MRGATAWGLRGSNDCTRWLLTLSAATPSGRRCWLDTGPIGGPWVQALAAAGYTVYALSPFQVSRCRDRHAGSREKFCPGAAHVLAEIVRFDRDHHRLVAGDGDIAEHVKEAARAQQSMIWSRQAQVNMLRSTLLEFHPAALAVRDLTRADALVLLAAAPSPEPGRRLTKHLVETLLARDASHCNITTIATETGAASASERLTARHGLVGASRGRRPSSSR